MDSQNQQVSLDDSVFKAYAKKIKDAADQPQNNNFPQRDYEDIEWSGLVAGVNKFYRLIGAPPSALPPSKTRDFDAVEVFVCDVKADDGKRMQIRIPLKTDQQSNDHILHRLYARVTEADWVTVPGQTKKKKINKNQDKYPELWEAVTKTGFKPLTDGKSYQYASGLKGQQVAIFNVIDRNDDWCAANKHTKLLSKEVGVKVNDDGKTNYYPKTGVPSFGFLQKLADQIAKYGNYENFDIAIKKTGEKTSPYELRNVSMLKSKDALEDVMNDDGSDINPEHIVIGPLTQEEIAYERYNLKHLFQPTSYSKILRRIPSVFKLCDACLGTTFYDELEKSSAAEKEEWKKLYGDAAAAQEEDENAAITTALNEEAKPEDAPEPVPKAARTRPAVGPVAPSIDPKKLALLKGYSALTDEEKSWIKDVKVAADGTLDEIVWIDSQNESLLYCDNCNKMSPSSLTTCPSCGGSFL
jgi:hypothetical protein